MKLKGHSPVDLIINNRKLIEKIYIVLVIFSLICVPMVGINYDLTKYLPDSSPSAQALDIMEDEFTYPGMGRVMLEDVTLYEAKNIKDRIADVDGVDMVMWCDMATNIYGSSEFINYDNIDDYYKDNTAYMDVIFTDKDSSNQTHKAVHEIENIVGDKGLVAGSAVSDTNLGPTINKEVARVMALAVVIIYIILTITTTSWFEPVLFLSVLGIAILINMGTNIIFGEISFLSNAVGAVLQLACSMDYSIFLLNSFEENKKRFPDDKERAMGHAIANTFKSVAGSSVTTVAGFLALCVMTFALGRDLGIVMAKGVLVGVICCVTILPALVLVFDGPIEKTRHKLLLSNIDKPSAFITKHYKAWIVIFLVLLFPAIYGNNHTKIYYNIAQSLPSTLDCNIANDELKKDFNLSNMHIIMLDKGMSAKDKEEMFKKIDDVDGVKWTLGMNSLVGAGVPDSMIPDDVKSMLESDDHELAFVCSKYESATDEVNAQIAQIDKIVKKYDDTGMVIGEAPLMKDLEDVTNVDLVRVNAISIIAIFIIILLVFKSISLPIILVAVIEFAIFVHIASPYYQGISLPFVASIVIGAIQLGATVDYAILMTTRYQKERMKGKDKMEAIGIAHRTSMPSIISSGLSFFAATFGVACYSKVEMIGSICTLLARGAIISTVVVLLILPAMFMIFDKVIIKTTKGFKQEQLESTPSAS